MNTKVLASLLIIGLPTWALPDVGEVTNDGVSAACDFKALQKIIFENEDPSSFVSLRESQNRPTCWDWCTDACTVSPDGLLIWNGSTYNFDHIDFKPACTRHDFSTRNLQRLGQFTEQNKNHSDTFLLDSLIRACGSHNGCVKVAGVYHKTVSEGLEPASKHNTWTQRTECTVFPGCCQKHTSSDHCGSKTGTGYSGDGSCVAK